MGLHYVPARPGGRQPTPDILGAVLKAESPEDEALRKHTEETAEIMQAMVWDYTQAGNNAAKVIEHTVEIKRNERRANEVIIEAGKHLLAVKELLPHGTWLDWLSVEFKMSQRTAYNMIGIAKRFGEKVATVATLTPSVLYLLAGDSVPEEAREEVIQRSQAGETVTKATAKAVIETHKADTIAPYKLPDRFDGLYSKCVLNGSTFVVVYAGDLPGNTSTRKFDDYHEMIAFMDRRLAAQQGSRAESTQPAPVQTSPVVVGEVLPGRGQLVAKHAIWKWLTERCGSNFRLMVELGEALHYQEMHHPLWSEMYPTGSNPDDVFWALEQCIDQAAALVPDFAQGPAVYVPTDTLRRAVLNWVRSRYEEYYGQVACLQCMIDDPMGDEDLQRMEPMLPTPYRKDDLIVAMKQALDYLRMDEPAESESEGEIQDADTLTAEDVQVMQGLPPLRLPSARLMQLKGLRAEFQMFVEESLETFGDLTGQHTATLEVGRKVMQLTAILDREIALLEGKEVSEE